MNDHELDDALAAVAPVRDSDLRSPATRAAVRAEVEEIVTMRTENERSELHLPARRPRIMAAVASAAAVVALAGVLVWSAGDEPGGIEPVGNGQVAGPPTAPDAIDELDVQIISATREALADSIMLQTQTDVSGHVTWMWSDEATGALRIASTGSDGGEVMFDSGPADPADLRTFRHVDHCFAEYTEGDRGAGVGPDGSPSEGGEEPIAPEPRSEADIIRGWLEAGDVVEDGTETFEGRDVIRMVWTVEERVMLVDAETYRPVLVVGYPGSDYEYTQTYEFLDRTDEHVAQLVPPVPESFVLVDELRGDGERLSAGCG